MTLPADVVVHGDRLTKEWPGGGGLAPLDFSLRARTLTALRGRSGSGKSTLLGLLAGWTTPTGGTIERDPSTAPLTWKGTAVVPQTLGLVPELTIRENVELPTRLSPHDETTDVAGLLESFDLTDLAERLPGELSLGQRQRVAVARAVVLRPALVLVDEPTSHQDEGHARAIMETLVAAAHGGSAVLVASHDAIVIDTAEAVIDLDA